jgi:UDP-N-acetylglucosamine transferase subunit ALG13
MTMNGHGHLLAGSGSIFEALTRSGSTAALVVVPNPLLMDNHQAELGQHLEALGHLVCVIRIGLQKRHVHKRCYSSHGSFAGKIQHTQSYTVYTQFWLTLVVRTEVYVWTVF